MRRLLFALLSIMGLLATACSPLTRDGVTGGPLPVVSTFSVIANLVQNVGGEYVSVTTLVGAGIDTHTFNPAPRDGAALADAQLIFENGAEFEGWLDDLYASTGSRAARVALAEGIPLHAADEHAAEEEHAEEAEHGHGGYDPHIWHDVANAIVMVGTIREALITADPAHQSEYEANAEAYIAQLQALDAWVVERVASLPPERRKLVTTHDTLAYFAERYGFEVLGTVLPATTEGASPSAQELAALVEAVRAAGVPAVFAENVSSSSLLNQVAAEAGVQVVASLYTDALGPDGSGAETYIDMVRHNVETIVSTLGARAP
jgi:ABC-type Zn uptake system ZnuABC Zn-binding protein ZnuA